MGIDRIEIRGTVRHDVRTADVRVEDRGIAKVEVRSGTPGPTGATGPAGPANLFIQPTAPVTALTEYQWWQTSAVDGNLVTLWVET